VDDNFKIEIDKLFGSTYVDNDLYFGELITKYGGEMIYKKYLRSFNWMEQLRDWLTYVPLFVQDSKLLHQFIILKTLACCISASSQILGMGNDSTVRWVQMKNRVMRIKI